MNDTIDQLLDRIAVQDFANAQPVFAELMASKLQDAIDAEKIRVAGQVFNNEGDEPVTDEDVENVDESQFDEDDNDIPE